MQTSTEKQATLCIEKIVFFFGSTTSWDHYLCNVWLTLKSYILRNNYLLYPHPLWLASPLPGERLSHVIILRSDLFVAFAALWLSWAPMATVRVSVLPASPSSPDIGLLPITWCSFSTRLYSTDGNVHRGPPYKQMPITNSSAKKSTFFHSTWPPHTQSMCSHIS